MKRNSVCASSFFVFSSVYKLHCIALLAMATLKFVVFCFSVTLIWRQRTWGNCRRPDHYCCFYEANLCLRKFILLLSFSLCTPLHLTAFNGHLEICRLLVKSKADVAAKDRCFSPPFSRHLSLTIYLAAVVGLHSNVRSTATKPTSLHTCAASARRNDALLRPAPRLLRAYSCQIKAILLRVAITVLLQLPLCPPLPPFLPPS